MNTQDIELPEPKYPGTKADIPNAIPDLYTAAQLRAAIEADRKHFAELFMDLSRYSNGMYEKDHDTYMEGVADGYEYAAEFLLGERIREPIK